MEIYQVYRPNSAPLRTVQLRPRCRRQYPNKNERTYRSFKDADVDFSTEPDEPTKNDVHKIHFDTL